MYIRGFREALSQFAICCQRCGCCPCVSGSDDCQEQLDFKDMKLQMLLVSLKELTATKEVIQTLEQLLCDESTQLQEERRQVAAPSKIPLGSFMTKKSRFVGVCVFR